MDPFQFDLKSESYVAGQTPVGWTTHLLGKLSAFPGGGQQSGTLAFRTPKGIPEVFSSDLNEASLSNQCLDVA